jgi:hypothetical protein
MTLFWNGLAKLGRGLRRENRIARAIRPRVSGGGEPLELAKRANRDGGTRDSALRCRCKRMTAMKLLCSRVGQNRANLESAYYVDSCVAVRASIDQSQ